MADESKTITITFRGDATSLDNTTSNIDKMIKVLQNDTKALQKKMKFGDDYATQMGYYDQAISNVGQSIALAQKNQATWNAEIEKYKNIMMNDRPLTEEELGHLLTAQRKYAEYTAQIENLTEQFKRLGKEQDNYNRLSVAEKLKDEGNQFKNLGRNINRVADSFKYVSLAAGAALTGSTMAAVNFESAMANVNKVLKDSEKGYFSSLQQEILDMSRELPLTAEEIAQVTANALQLGVSARDVSKFTETILKLGTATNISADEAAIALAQFFNITGESLQNVDKFGAVLTSLGNQFPTFESDIMEMSTRIAAAGTSIGMSSQDILGLSTALTSVGLSAEAGGSSISQILRTIDTQVATSGKKLRAWATQAGMSVDEFKRAWSEDATGTFQLLVNSLAQGVDNGENLNAMLKDLGITAIRQTDAFSRLVQANDTLNDALGESAKAWQDIEKGESGALNDEFAQKVKTLAAQFQLLKNDLFALGVTIGQQVMPYLQRAIDFARELVNQFIRLSPEAKKWVVGLLAGLASIYPILKTVGTAISGIGTLLLGLSGIVQNKLMFAQMGEKMFGGILTAFKTFATSIAIPVAAIAALAGAFALLYKNNETFSNAIDRLTNAFKFGIIRTTQQLLNILKEFSTWFMSKIQPLMDYLIQLYHTFIEPTLSYLFSALTELIFDVIKTLYQWIVKIIQYLINIAKPIIDVIIKLIKAVATFLSPVVGLIFTLIGAIIELVGWLWDKLKPAIDETITIIGNIIQAFAEVASMIADVVLVAVQWLVDKFAEFFGFLKDTGVITTFTSAFQGVVTVIQNAVKWFTDLLDKLAQFKKENPSLGTIKSEYENRNGVRVGTSGVYNTTFNFNQSNKISGTSTNTAQKLADDVLSLVNNGIGKQLDTRGW